MNQATSRARPAPQTHAGHPPAPRDLERVLGLGDLIMLVIGAVIGSGIFIVPATVLQQTNGDVRLSLLVWLAGGVLSLLGALAYGELGAMRPESGGLYAYIRDAFGRFPAFVYGWTLFFVIGSGSMATLAVAFNAYFGQLVALSPVAAKLLSLAMIACIIVVNVLSTRGSANLQNWTSGLKVVAIVAMSLALLAVGGGVEAAAAPAEAPAARPSLFAALGVAMIGVLWAYEGWQYPTFSAGETRDPQRTFPLGIAVGTGLLIAVYCLAVIGYVAALGPRGVMSTDSVAAAAVGALFGPSAARLIAVAILVSIVSAANSVLLTSTRVFFAMARDGLFFQRLAEVHPRFGTPAVSIVATGLWAMVLAATGTFSQLLTYVVFSGWIFYSLGGAALFALRRKEPHAHRPFRVPGYPIVPALFVLAGSAVVLNAIVTQPRESAVGIAIVLIAAPAFLFWRSRPAVRERTGSSARG